MVQKPRLLRLLFPSMVTVAVPLVRIAPKTAVSRAFPPGTELLTQLPVVLHVPPPLVCQTPLIGAASVREKIVPLPPAPPLPPKYVSYCEVIPYRVWPFGLTVTAPSGAPPSVPPVNVYRSCMRLPSTPIEKILPCWQLPENPLYWNAKGRAIQGLAVRAQGQTAAIRTTPVGAAGETP